MKVLLDYFSTETRGVRRITITVVLTDDGKTLERAVSGNTEEGAVIAAVCEFFPKMKPMMQSDAIWIDCVRMFGEYHANAHVETSRGILLGLASDECSAKAMFLALVNTTGQLNGKLA